MRFRILGPTLVSDGTSWTGVGPAKWRSLLATLLIKAGDVVPFDQLVHELWGDHPPKTATTQVHGYVMRIRRALGDPRGRLLVTTAPGYRLAVAPAEIDAQRFAVLASEGRAALQAGDAQRAADLLGEALALWRGDALCDVPPTSLVRTETDRLTEQRLAAWESRIEADLACGRHGVVIGELQRHVAEHPLREQPWHHLMLALHRSRRRAEALQTYRRLRQTLIDELGVEPCAAIQALHHHILTDSGQAAVRAVSQLPADLPDFTGRAEPLDMIVRTLSGGVPEGPPPVVVVYGSPGVGKSALAVHAARAVSSAFPDGQVYLDLGDPADMLADLLRSLGVTAIPHGLQARAARFRSMLTGKRILLVLDDAARADQIRPLLPPTGDSAVVITSRRLMTDLPGAVHVELDVFRHHEARQLLMRVAGSERVSREPIEADAIVRSCGYLPLAIRIAGGKLAGRPAWSLRVVAQRLACESRRLSELTLGELNVRASFDKSLRLLPDEAVRAFRLLGLLGAQTVPAWVIGRLLDRPDADDVLDELVDANLVRLVTMDSHGQPNYRLPDLLRVHAVEGASAIPAHDRQEALRRVLGFAAVTEAAAGKR
ncbi:AfsR/SARP family transcriptional regulator [Kibdelosporangium aridum]|uniref:AfsR/SARP family transcriptional regulator n=1 Tax=Kibdelosporangium aridum TaxID=2030 RepID=UPI00068F5ED4|nr:AfsR/SARP family transcriptional regulator [Kibdelosporangium aridum]